MGMGSWRNIIRGGVGVVFDGGVGGVLGGVGGEDCVLLSSEVCVFPA